MITAVNTTFTELINLEMGFPLWRILPTPSLRRLFEAQDFFAEYVSKLKINQLVNYYFFKIVRTSAKYINQTLDKIQNRPAESEVERTILEELLVRGMSPQDAVELVINMLMAGIDTTSNSTSFMLYLLAKNPDKQEILRKEVLSVVGPRGAPVTVAALNELRYLKACVKESLR